MPNGEFHQEDITARLEALREARITAIASLKEQFGLQFAALEEKIGTRLDAMDDAQRLLHDNLTRVPTDTDKQVNHLASLIDARMETVTEKFTGISTQFRERDVRVAEAAKTNTDAINAALQAQKEAAAEQAKNFREGIDKSERGTGEKIDQISRMLDANSRGQSDKSDGLKERVVILESMGLGRAAAVTDRRSDAGDVRGNVGMIVGLVGGLVGLTGLIVVLTRLT